MAEPLPHVEILGQILRTLHRLEKTMADQNYTTQQILDAVTAERTQITSLSTMIGTLKDRLNAELAGKITPDAQATLNAIMSEVQGNARALTDAINSVPQNGSGAGSVGSTAGGAQGTAVGDTTGTASGSGGVAQNPQKTATSITISTSKTQVNAGERVTFTAGVNAPSSDKPITGSVDFKADGGLIGSASVESTGVAAIEVPVPAGTHAITALYSGDSNYEGSTSEAIQQIGIEGGTSQDVSGSNQPAPTGQPAPQPEVASQQAS